jgi:small GTP-binding protein
LQILKLLVTGDVDAGKTEFIRTISEIDIVSTDARTTDEYAELKDETTVAMDFGRLTIAENLVLHLYGTPGQERFDFMWDILSKGILGFVVLVDSSRPKTFIQARRIIDFFHDATEGQCPYVVAANKQDISGGFTLEDVKTILSLPENIPVVPCVALDHEYVKNVIIGLCEAVLKGKN